MSKLQKTKRKGRPRQEHEKKPNRKGIKLMRGQPEVYDELKKIASFSLRPTAQSGLNYLLINARTKWVNTLINKGFSLYVVNCFCTHWKL